LMAIMRRLAAVLLLTAILLPSAAQAGYIGSQPDEGIYVTQTRKHTCTLIATTMMLRNFAAQNGSPYEQVTESSVGRYAWNDIGLIWNFTIGTVNVRCSSEILNWESKKDYLIHCLSLHPEGIVIYDANAPHAIWLFGYDDETDIFYCADTTTSVAGRKIPLVYSIIPGETQEDKIRTIDRIWYIADREAEAQV